MSSNLFVLLLGLVPVWAGGGVGVPLGWFGPWTSGAFLLTVPGSIVCVVTVLFRCFLCASVCWCLVVACWGRVRGAGLLALVCGV